MTTIHAIDPATGASIGPAFRESTVGEVARALERTHEAFTDYRARPARERANVLRAIAREVDAAADVLTPTERAETALPVARLDGERARTVDQLRLIAANDEELSAHTGFVARLAHEVPRIIRNGVPTGVEVSHAMQHGGEYPASTDERATSVGTASLTRFARPVCYQGVPDAALPEALRNANPLGNWRLVDGELPRDAL